jgi:hypothetical protein
MKSNSGLLSSCVITAIFISLWNSIEKFLRLIIVLCTHTVVVGLRGSSSRDCHGYRKTHGFAKTGSAGTGTVVDFGTPRHTAYPHRGIAGISRVHYHLVSIIFFALKLVYSRF